MHSSQQAKGQRNSIRSVGRFVCCPAMADQDFVGVGPDILLTVRRDETLKNRSKTVLKTIQGKTCQ